MTKKLRKGHLQIWTALMLLLPVGIICSWVYLPGAATVQSVKHSTAALLPVVVQSFKGNCYTAAIRSNSTKTSWQLEWTNEKPLTTPSAVIYREINAAPGISNKEMIGRIEAKGSYVFPLRAGAAGNAVFRFVVYDFIHETIIDSFKIRL